MTTDQEIARLRNQVESLQDHNQRLAWSRDFERRRANDMEAQMQQLIETMGAMQRAVTGEHE